jgi:hypothetical protein
MRIKCEDKMHIRPLFRLAIQYYADIWKCNLGRVMRSNVLNLCSIRIQLLTALHTYRNIFPHTFKTAVKYGYTHTR